MRRLRIRTRSSRPTTCSGPSGGEILAPLTKDLGRRAKRALQDEQNELLDQIRTVKGRSRPSDVLPTADARGGRVGSRCSTTRWAGLREAT